MDLGSCGIFPWTNLYEVCDNKLPNFNGVGWYIVEDGMCYVMAKGSGTGVISLPNPKSITTVNIYNMTDNTCDELDFTGGKLTLKTGCEYLVNFYYEVI